MYARTVRSASCQSRHQHSNAQVLWQLAPHILPLLEPYLLEASDIEQTAVDATEQGMSVAGFAACTGCKPVNSLDACAR